MKTRDRMLALCAPVVLVFGVLSGHVTSLWTDSKPEPQVVEVREVQTHTVVRYRPFEVVDTYCPEEDSCKAEYHDGAWYIVEVQH